MDGVDGIRAEVSTGQMAFLTAAHLARYGRYPTPLTPEHLASDAFMLTPADHQRMADLRHDHTRLGFALQLCTLRFLSTFLPDPTEVPAPVVGSVCAQLEGVHCVDYLGGHGTEPGGRL